jgi:hypothetical protein
MWRRSLVVAVALAAAACSTGGDGQPPALEDIVLQADEAPEGTRKVADAGGQQDLDAFARNAAERAALVEDGFVTGYVAYFAPEAYFDPEEFVDEDAVSFQVIAGRFEDADGASSSLHRFMEDLRGRQLDQAEAVEAPPLGDESFGLSGRSAGDGSAVLVLLWREGDLLLVVIGSGAFDEESVAGAARAMAERAG